MKQTLIFIGHLSIFIFLTALTQVGGVVYLISIFISKRFKNKFRLKNFLVFGILYIVVIFLIVPVIAPLFGREKIKNSTYLQPTNYITVLLNRNYVVPSMNKVLLEAQKSVSEVNLQIHYLDACFPFMDRFPLLPHLSHNDGKKLDLSFVYSNAKGEITNKERSMSGYGVFVEPRSNEKHQNEFCLKQGYWQYDMAKYISFGTINPKLQFSEVLTRRLLLSIIDQSRVKKIFIEPHLKERLNINHPKVRFHGCHAVRHDDHIHIEVK